MAWSQRASSPRNSRKLLSEGTPKSPAPGACLPPWDALCEDTARTVPPSLAGSGPPAPPPGPGWRRSSTGPRRQSAPCQVPAGAKQIPQPQSRHGIQLGKGPEHNQIGILLQQSLAGRPVRKGQEALVHHQNCSHPATGLQRSRHRPGLRQGAGGVVGVAEEYHLVSRPDRPGIVRRHPAPAAVQPASQPPHIPKKWVQGLGPAGALPPWPGTMRSAAPLPKTSHSSGTPSWAAKARRKARQLRSDTGHTPAHGPDCLENLFRHTQGGSDSQRSPASHRRRRKYSTVGSKLMGFSSISSKKRFHPAAAAQDLSRLLLTGKHQDSQLQEAAKAPVQLLPNPLPSSFMVSSKRPKRRSSSRAASVVMQAATARRASRDAPRARRKTPGSPSASPWAEGCS